jgi:hypothetical protein
MNSSIAATADASPPPAIRSWPLVITAAVILMTFFSREAR